jgi:hypothetical protein
MPSTAPSELWRPFTSDKLILWIMHHLAEVFTDHAILKGGMALRLLDSPRETNDLDYVFVPYRSKKDILPKLKRVIAELRGAEIDWTVHSTMARAHLRIDRASVQLELNVAPACESTPISTEALARVVDEIPRAIRIMHPKTALAHKLAAWNERRLLRDLYDIYFLANATPAGPDATVLAQRLARVRSRLPALRNKRTMSLAEFADELVRAVAALDDDVLRELAPLLPPEILPGLALRMRRVIIELAGRLRR